MSRELCYDVVVVGGGTAGVSAAVGAAKAGAKTLLLERNPYLGGEATHSGVGAFAGFFTCGENPVKVVAGVGELVLQAMEGLGHTLDYIISATGNRNINFHPEYLKCAMDQVLKESGADCLLHTQVVGVSAGEGVVKELRCVDDEGPFTVRAGAYVDATGDGNLCHMAGASTVWGDDQGKVQAATLPFRLSGVDTTQDMTPGAVERAVLKAKEAGIPYLTKEKGFILKMEGSGVVSVLLPSVIPQGLSGAELTRMEQDARNQVLYYVQALKRYMPGMEHCELAVIGPAIGLRETRRLVGRETVTGEDALKRRKRPDGVARCGWKPEIHKDVNKMGTYMEVAPGSYFDIPLGALESVDYNNLYGAGRMISSEETAQAAIRVMGTCFATGHAAGVAAAVRAGSGRADLERIQSVLREQGALI